MMSMSSTPSEDRRKKLDAWRGGGGRDKGRTHALATDDIGEPTEKELTDESSNGSSDLDTKVLVGGKLLVWKEEGEKGAGMRGKAGAYCGRRRSRAW